MSGRKFTTEDDQFLRDNYLTTPAKRMAKMLGRSEGTGRQRMKILGLVVPPEIIEKFKKDSQIKKGDVSHNKGKKQSDYMSKEAIELTAKTRFKKGNIPYNAYDTDGVINVRKDTKTGIDYLYIRVKLGVWVLYQRYQYEKFIGEIPAGHIVALKDGDPKNCHPFNLELKTKAENMERNSGPLRLPDGQVATYLAVKSKKVDRELRDEYLKHPELITLKRNQLLLNREIKKYGNSNSIK